MFQMPAKIWRTIEQINTLEHEARKSLEQVEIATKQAFVCLKQVNILTGREKFEGSLDNINYALRAIPKRLKKIRIKIKNIIAHLPKKEDLEF